MVHKKNELTTNSTIECLLPPVPSVPQILEENLKYEEELKKQEKLHKKNRKKRKGSHTSTKFLPDWINDVQCAWAHNHDFRDYSKSNALKYNQRNNGAHLNNNNNTKNQLNLSKKRHRNKHKRNESLSNSKYNRKNYDAIMDEIELKSNVLAPSETSPAFESPAQSPDEQPNAKQDSTPPALDINANDPKLSIINPSKLKNNSNGNNKSSDSPRKKSPIHHYKTRSVDNKNLANLLGLGNMKQQKSISHSKSASHSKSHSMSNSLVGAPLTPLNEANVVRRSAIMHHTPTPNDRIGSHGMMMNNGYAAIKSHGARSRSVSDSVGSDYGFTPYGPGMHNEYEHSLSHSESMPVDQPDLTREVTQHLERVINNNDDNKSNKKGMHKKMRSDSMLPSELKKRYKTKIKQIGKSIKEESKVNDNKSGIFR